MQHPCQFLCLDFVLSELRAKYASSPTFLFMGGALQVGAGFLEFFLGNTFPFVVFSSFGGFWLSFGATLQPFYGVGAAYEATGGTESPAFAASFGIIINQTLIWPKSLWFTSILPSKYGSSLLHLSHLLYSHQHHPGIRICLPSHGVRLPVWSILATCQRQYCGGGQTSSRKYNFSFDYTYK